MTSLSAQRVVRKRYYSNETFWWRYKYNNCVLCGNGGRWNGSERDDTRANIYKKKNILCRNVSGFSNKDCVGCRKFCTYILGFFIGHLQFGIIMIHPVLLQSRWYTFITQFFSWVSLMPCLYRHNRKYIVSFADLHSVTTSLPKKSIEDQSTTRTT